MKCGLSRKPTVYDISVTLGKESIDYPGDTPFSTKRICAIGPGSPYNLTSMTMSLHTGAHLDAPAHFIARGKTIDAYPLERFILPARVISIDDPEAIRPAHIQAAETEPGEALLFQTENSRRGRATRPPFAQDFVHLTPEAARLCVEKRLALVGIDYITIERPDAAEFPTHQTLLGNDILILEGLNLAHVPTGRYTLYCLPLKLQGVEGAPTRAILTR